MWIKQSSLLWHERDISKIISWVLLDNLKLSSNDIEHLLTDCSLLYDNLWREIYDWQYQTSHHSSKWYANLGKDSCLAKEMILINKNIYIR